jgi:hypothetical protein
MFRLAPPLSAFSVFERMQRWQAASPQRQSKVSSRQRSSSTSPTNLRCVRCGSIERRQHHGTSVITLIVCRPIVVMPTSLGVCPPLEKKLTGLLQRPGRPSQKTCGGCALNADYLKKSWRLRRGSTGTMSAGSKEVSGTSQLTT